MNSRRTGAKTRSTLAATVALTLAVTLAAPAMAQVTIRHSHDGEHGPQWRQWLEHAKARFEAENPGIKIELEFQGRAAQTEKLLLTYGTDLFPDVVETFAAHHYQFMAAGMFADLNRHMATDPDLSWDQFPPHILGNSTVGGLPGEGRTWLIPVSIWVNGPTFNDDHFAESALVPPSRMEHQWTWNDFIDIGRKLVRYNSEGQVVRWAYRPGDWKVWVHNAGGWIFDRYVDPARVTLNDERVREALRFLQNVYQTDGLVNPNTDIIRGDASVWIQTGPNVTRILQGAGVSFEWSYGPNPKSARGGAELVVIGLSMSSQTKHPQEAWRWIKFLVAEAARDHIAITGRPAAWSPVAREYAGLIPDATPWEHVWVELITRPDSYDRPVVHTTVMNAMNAIVRDILDGKVPADVALDAAQDQISALLEANRFYRDD